MTKVKLTDLEQQQKAYFVLEGEIHAQLVAVDMVGGLNEELFDPEVEKTMTFRKAVEIIATIDHEELDKVGCNWQAVYDELQDRYGAAIAAVDQLNLKIQQAGNKVRLQAIETITDTVNEFTQDLDAEDTDSILLVDNLLDIVRFLKTGELD